MRSWFVSSRSIAALNTVGLGLALAGSATPVIVGAFGGAGTSGTPIALSTFVLGSVWALALRWRRRFPGTGVRIGWVASVPLAALNAGISFASGGRVGLMFDEGPVAAHHQTVWDFLSAMFFGMTFGAVVWVPALMATIVFFGGPMKHAQDSAEQGLVEAEQGEIYVAAVCTFMCVVGLAIRTAQYAAVMSAVGVLVGVSSITLSLVRGRRRRAFIAEVTAGRMPGYRVEETDAGRALVRTAPSGVGYRVADFDVEVLPFEQAGAELARRS